MGKVKRKRSEEKIQDPVFQNAENRANPRALRSHCRIFYGLKVLILIGHVTEFETTY